MQNELNYLLKLKSSSEIYNGHFNQNGGIPRLWGDPIWRYFQLCLAHCQPQQAALSSFWTAPCTWDGARSWETFPPRWEDRHPLSTKAYDLIHSICLDIDSTPAYLPQKVCNGCLCATGWGADQCWSKQLLRAHGLTKKWFALSLAPYCAVNLTYLTVSGCNPPLDFWLTMVSLLTQELCMTVWYFLREYANWQARRGWEPQTRKPVEANPCNILQRCQYL